MLVKGKTLYLSGLIRMASHNLGHSYMDAWCFEKEEYVNGFRSYFKLKNEVMLEEISQDIHSFFKEVLFLDDQEVKNLVYWISRSLGEHERIMTVSDSKTIDNLSGTKGLAPFFFVEEVYFIEYSDKVLCLMTGNDE